jgi:hypothetical protein
MGGDQKVLGAQHRFGSASSVETPIAASKAFHNLKFCWSVAALWTRRRQI